MNENNTEIETEMMNNEIPEAYAEEYREAANKHNSENDAVADYQILISDIKWNSKSTRSYVVKSDSDVDLPEQFTISLPENKFRQAKKQQKKSETEFRNVIESYVYDFLTHKFNHEVYSCSIFLPLLEDEKKYEMYIETK